MTTITTDPAARNVIGPYSRWPRKRTIGKRRAAALTGAAATGAIFVHCVLPAIT